MKNNLVCRPVLAVLLAFSAPTLWAHPGHDLLDHGASHVLLSPYHLLVLALAGVTLLALGFFASKSAAKQALRWSGVAVLACSALLWGFSR